MTDVATRWNSAHDMLEWFIEQQPAICAALRSAEVRKNAKDLWTLNDADLSCAEDVAKALKPLKVVWREDPYVIHHCTAACSAMPQCRDPSYRLGSNKRDKKCCGHGSWEEIREWQALSVHGFSTGSTLQGSTLPGRGWKTGNLHLHGSRGSPDLLGEDQLTLVRKHFYLKLVFYS